MSKQQSEVISIGTIKIKNLSKVSDRIAVKLVADYWLGTLKDEHMKFWKISIKKKGHSFTVVDREDGGD